MEKTETIEKRLRKIEDLLISQKTVLNFNEASEFIGMSKSTLYRLTSTGNIPHYKPTGKNIFFNRGELQNWMLRNPVKTKDQIEQEAESYILKHK